MAAFTTNGVENSVSFHCLTGKAKILSESEKFSMVWENLNVADLR